MTELVRKTEILQDISAQVAGNLQSVAGLILVGATEIESNGQISQETCESMAALMSQTENKALKLFTGLLSVHQSMAKYMPEGANEGNKVWPTG